MTALIDTHAHPQTRPFTADRDEVLRRARAAGVAAIVVVGFDATTNRDALVLARQHAGLWATAGIHPHDAAAASGADWDAWEEQARDPLVVALGEMGLDFYRNLSPHDTQRAALQRQLELCARLDVPAVIHSRDAEPATWEMIEPWARARRRNGGTEPFGVMHCYAYGPEAARRYAALGLMISVPGTVTYPKNERGRSVAATVPDDALVLETDCPYLTPQSHRGKRNEPAYITETLAMVARLRRVPPEQIATLTTANARRLFRLDAAATRRAAMQLPPTTSALPPEHTGVDAP